MLIKHATEMEKKAEHFDQLRKILRIAEPEGSDGLNDDALNCDMTVMKAEIIYACLFQCRVKTSFKPL